MLKNILTYIILVLYVFQEEKKASDTVVPEQTNREKFGARSSWGGSDEIQEEDKSAVEKKDELTEAEKIEQISKEATERNEKVKVPEVKEETKEEKKETKEKTETKEDEDIVEIERDGKKVKLNIKTGTLVEDTEASEPSETEDKMYKIGKDTIDSGTFKKVMESAYKELGRDDDGKIDMEKAKVNLKKMTPEALSIYLEHHLNYVKGSAAMNQRNIEDANKRKELDDREANLKALQSKVSEDQKRIDMEKKELETRKKEAEALTKEDPNEIEDDIERQKKIAAQVQADDKIREIDRQLESNKYRDTELKRNAEGINRLFRISELQSEYPELKTKGKVVDIIDKVITGPDDVLDSDPELEEQYEIAKRVQDIILDYEDTDKSMTIKKFYRINKGSYKLPSAQTDKKKLSVVDLRKDQIDKNISEIFENQKTPDEVSSSTESKSGTPTEEKGRDNRLRPSKEEYRKRSGWAMPGGTPY